MSDVDTAEWFRAFAGRVPYPDNYVCIDTETSGLSPETDFICGIGVVVVHNRQIANTYETFLDWSKHPGIDMADFAARLGRVEQGMRRQGKSFHHNLALLQTRGIEPRQALEQHLGFFEDLEARGITVVGHNACTFDCELFQAHFHNYLGVGYRFPGNLIYDTGIIEKASQLSIAEHDSLPLPDETLQEFYWRIRDIRKRGVKWALDGHCEDRYQLSVKCGNACENFHWPGYDATAIHHVFEAHRQQACG